MSGRTTSIEEVIVDNINDMMLDNPEEAEYYLRFIVMYIDLATDTVRKIFHSLTPGPNVDTFFASDDVKNKLESMLKGNGLNRKEYELVTRSHVRPEAFDISLLITLLCHLYPSKLKAPTNGWKLPVDPGDITIAADLLRLREIRNKTVAHQPRAIMAEPKFITIWGDVEKILVRLTQQIDSGFETTLKEKINDYRTRPLDPQDENYRKYLDMLKEWFDSIMKLQEQVEESLKKMEEIHQYFRKKPANYVHYIRLLLDVGKPVLRGLLEREISKRGGSLQVILQDKCSVLKDIIGDEELLKQLFPNFDDKIKTNLDIERVDIIVIASILICILDDSADSEGDIISDVNTILDARRRYAEHALEASDHPKFTTISWKLMSSINFLCSVLDSDTRKHCNKLIANLNEPQGNENNDDEKYFDELKSHGPGIKSILDVFNETLNGLKAFSKKMEENGTPFLKCHILDLKIVTLGKNEEKRKVVEDTVATLWQAALERSGNSSDFPTVRQALDQILEDIRRIPGVEVGDLERKCILLFLRCNSWRGMLQLAEYFESFRFKQHLQNISVEMSLIYDETISIQGHLTFECLRDILNHQPAVHDDNEQTISVPIKCSSVGAMKEVLKVLSNEKTTNRFNEIANTLVPTHTVGETMLKHFPDVYGFKDVFDETDSENSSSGKFSDGEEADGTLFDRQNVEEDQKFFADISIDQTEEIRRSFDAAEIVQQGDTEDGSAEHTSDNASENVRQSESSEGTLAHAPKDTTDNVEHSDTVEDNILNNINENVRPGDTAQETAGLTSRDTTESFDQSYNAENKTGLTLHFTTKIVKYSDDAKETVGHTFHHAIENVEQSYTAQERRTSCDTTDNVKQSDKADYTTKQASNDTPKSVGQNDTAKVIVEQTSHSTENGKQSYNAEDSGRHTSSNAKYYSKQIDTVLETARHTSYDATVKGEHNHNAEETTEQTFYDTIDKADKVNKAVFAESTVRQFSYNVIGAAGQSVTVADMTRRSIHGDKENDQQSNFAVDENEQTFHNATENVKQNDTVEGALRQTSQYELENDGQSGYVAKTEGQTSNDATKFVEDSDTVYSTAVNTSQDATQNVKESATAEYIVEQTPGDETYNVELNGTGEGKVEKGIVEQKDAKQGTARQSASAECTVEQISKQATENVELSDTVEGNVEQTYAKQRTAGQTLTHPTKKAKQSDIAKGIVRHNSCDGNENADQNIIVEDIARQTTNEVKQHAEQHDTVDRIDGLASHYAKENIGKADTGEVIFGHTSRDSTRHTEKSNDAEERLRQTSQGVTKKVEHSVTVGQSTSDAVENIGQSVEGSVGHTSHDAIVYFEQSVTAKCTDSKTFHDTKIYGKHVYAAEDTSEQIYDDVTENVELHCPIGHTSHDANVNIDQSDTAEDAVGPFFFDATENFEQRYNAESTTGHTSNDETENATLFQSSKDTVQQTYPDTAANANADETAGQNSQNSDAEYPAERADAKVNAERSYTAEDKARQSSNATTANVEQSDTTESTDGQTSHDKTEHIEQNNTTNDIVGHTCQQAPTHVEQIDTVVCLARQTFQYSKETKGTVKQSSTPECSVGHTSHDATENIEHGDINIQTAETEQQKILVLRDLKATDLVETREVFHKQNATDQETQYKALRQRTTELDDNYTNLENTQLEQFEKLLISSIDPDGAELRISSSSAPSSKDILILDNVRCNNTGCKGHSINLSEQEKIQELTFESCDNVVNCINPKSIEIESYNLSHEQCTALSIFLSKAVKMNRLILKSVKCEMTGCKGHNIDLSDIAELQELVLHNCDHLFVTCVDPARLESVEIKWCYLSHEQFSFLLACLSKAPLIRKLILDNVRLEDYGYKHSSSKSLTNIRFNENYSLRYCEIRNSKFLHDELVLILSFISFALDLKELKLVIVDCFKKGCEGHCFDFSRHEKLQSLTLDYFDSFRFSGLNQNLELCEISHSKLSHEGLSSLSAGIDRAIYLKRLKLDQVTCSTITCEGHCIDLSNHNKLQKVTLQSCKELFCKNLKKLNCLREVELYMCEFSHKQLVLLSSELEMLDVKVRSSSTCTWDKCEGHTVKLSGEQERLTPRRTSNFCDTQCIMQIK